MSGRNNQSSNDFLMNLLNNPIPSPANSSSNPQTSSSHTINVNLYSQPFYNQTGFHPIPSQFQSQFQNQQFQSQFQNLQTNSQYFSEQPNTQVPETPPTHQSEVGSADVNVTPDVPLEKESPNKGRRKQTKWTEADTVILAERWVDASENPIQGNSQTEEFFWNGIVNAFNSLVEQKRSKNQLTGKWSRIRTDVKSFGGILKKYTNQRQSGADEKAVYDAAKDHFKQQIGRFFVYEACYHVLKDCPKFWNDHGLISNKRATRDEAPLDVDDDGSPPGFENPQPNPIPNLNPRIQALFQDDEIRRPVGRDVSRKSQKSRSSSDATSSRHTDDECKAEYLETQKAKQRALKTIEEYQREKGVLKALTFINTPIDESLPEQEKRRIVKYKNKLLKKYEQDFKNMSDEDED